MEIRELLNILKQGESEIIEFKETLKKDIRKDICALANTNGGLILIGVKDDGTPLGITEHNFKQVISDSLQSLYPHPEFAISEVPIAQTIIVVIKVKKSSRLISHRNIVYIRAGTNNYPLSIDEIMERSAEVLRVFFDRIRSSVPYKEIEEDLFKKYLQDREETRGVKNSGKHVDIALQMKFAEKDADNQIFLTNAGILCFSENPGKYISGSTVRLIEFNDDDMNTYSDRKEFSGTLLKIVEDIEAYFSKNISRVGGYNVGFRRQEFSEYPLKALRETVVNAIIHRNYFDPSETNIYVFPNRIEIRNPGAFPPGVSVEEPEHKPRNPTIAQFFYDVNFAEKYGSGIKKILKETFEHPLTEVKFEIKPSSTHVIFTKTVEKFNLDEKNQRILEILSSGRKSSSQVAEYIGLSKQATVSRLNDLKALGLVGQSGRGSGTTYRAIRTR